MPLITTKKEVYDLIEMINAMARLDFSKRIKTGRSESPINILGQGLNMLSEELKYKVIEKERLEEINQNLERFSFTVAHDLKSPILASNGLIDFMHDELQTNGEIPSSNLKEYLEILKDANTQISKLINGILQYSRLENDRMEISQISLQDLCWAVTKDYRNNDRVKISYPNCSGMISYNETALEQVLRNLINNAIKYCDKDLCLVSIECQEENTHHIISVSDNGPGLKEDEKEIIFNLFENLRNASYESSGVGLAIVDKLVSKAGGKIWVEDAQPTGARFVFTIPKRNHN